MKFTIMSNQGTRGEKTQIFRTLDEWKERMKQPKPHKCAAIFIDNSGLDVVLGILPFAEELLR